MTAVGGPSGNSRLVPIPPDGGWGWVVVLGSFFVHVFADGFVYSFGVLVEVLMKEFNSDNTVCAMIISLLTGLTLGSGPLASAICNKYGCRATTITGAIIASVGCTFSYFATEMWHIVFSVGVIMGVGFGLMYCPAIVIVTMYFEKWRSLATGIAVAGAGVGTVLFSPINEYIISHYGWRAVFLAFLGVLALCVLCGWTFRPLEFREVSDDDEDGADSKKPEAATIEESAALLSSDEKRALSSSHDQIRVAKSLDDVIPARRKRSDTVGERDVGYLNRKDVFYTGSITNVAEFKECPDKYRSTGSLHRRTLSQAGAMSSDKLQEVRETSEEVSEDTTTDNVEGSNMFKTISRMLSLSLLIDPTFLIFAISNLLTSVGFNSPLYFLPLHATKGVGLDAPSASRGVGTVFGPPISGYLADLTNTYVWSFVFCGANLLMTLQSGQLRNFCLSNS
ncbi:unnamed protein product [Nippostrongylus brasiliensis]|uniref:EG:103B4.3 protein (inferred by orthology to a D. melanogaster protein) n=1 Tax=Nippostrongylus brasiliensis TaxID=27835 RepID=A0A0N4XV05_NIPBR|nr:unnamed protein product [Nippostrongylus brasiliensis]